MLSHIDWTDVIRKIQPLATSDVAKEKISLLAPLPSSREACRSFQKIDDACSLLHQGPRPFMESLDFFNPWASRLKKEAVLKILEIKDVRWFCQEALTLKEFIENSSREWIEFLQEELLDASAPLEKIDSIMTPSGEIRTDASEKLSQLIKEKRSLAREISKTLDHLTKDHGMEPILQDKYVTTREGRWVLPIKGGMQHEIEGVIHASSNSKQTVFMEPQQIIPINNRIRQIEIDIEDEIERLLRKLSLYLRSLLEQFQQSYGLMVEVDIILSLARFTQLIGANPCRFSEDKLELNSVRHPLLVFETQNLSNHSTSIVANDVSLDREKQILLLSGPNAGGKTILLKAIGLTAHMARCGLPICAEKDSLVPFFEHITVAVGDAQSVDEHLSTFAAHLKILNENLKYKGPRSLVLIDEICGSTDPEEGSAIARSFINAYADNKVYGVITSHLGPLKVGWSESSKVINGSLEYDKAKDIPTYQFLPGIAGESLAIQTAKRIGINTAIIKQAIDFLSPESQKHLESMEDIETLRRDILAMRNSLNQERKEVNKLKSHYESLLHGFEKEKQQHLEKSVKKAERTLDHMISNTKVEQIFRKHETLSQIKKEFPQIIRSAGNNRDSSSNVVDSPEAFADKFPPGSNVFVSHLKQNGIVQGTPNQKGLVPVLANSLRLILPWHELLPPKSTQNPTAKTLRGHQYDTSGGFRTVDLRGLTVDGALETLEIQLDKATLQQEDRVKIIHGHGTDSLKKAIRSYLSRSLYVQKWSSSAKKTETDSKDTSSGVTWAELH